MRHLYIPLRLMPGMLLLIMLGLACNTRKQPTEDVIELHYEDNQSVSYTGAIAKYKKLDSAFARAKLLKAGTTDVGKPLHLFVISEDEQFDPRAIKAGGKRALLINNGVHPGEPCGMDASLQFANDILLNKDSLGQYLENTVIAIVPVYSVGGALKRTPYIRSNQVGPDARGRRGNARNLDLNRDYMKQDSRNALSLARIFQRWQPDVFLDTHTTNGSDHQYTITLIPVQPSSFPPALENLLRKDMLPALYSGMRETPYELIPYVMYNETNARDGILSYMQQSRVSTGYARLFNTLGFMTENHVYKPFPERVKSVYHFLRVLTRYTSKNGDKIAQARYQANKQVQQQKTFTLSYELDSSQKRMTPFKGYEKGEVKSALTGLYYKGYNHNRPFYDTIPFYNHYRPGEQVKAPDYYLVPQAWRHVVERLQANGVRMHRLTADTTLMADVYYTTGHENLPKSYNGHFYHKHLDTELRREQMRFFRGDFVVPVNQKRNRYIVEALEPKASDSFFRWNFFDACLERRDWNGPRVTFEKNAIRYLNKHPQLRDKFDEKRRRDTAFANDHKAQLRYIFEHSEWSRSIVGRYPVARIVTEEMEGR